MTGEAEALPHDTYMEAVANELTDMGLPPTSWWTETPDGAQLDAVFTFSAAAVNADHWPHGVYLGWDQHNGWLLIEDGGPRNINPLGQASRTYSDPRQIAVDVGSQLRKGTDCGPICTNWRGDAIASAVAAWDTQ